jgi:hypothetical protein
MPAKAVAKEDISSRNVASIRENHGIRTQDDDTELKEITTPFFGNKWSLIDLTGVSSHWVMPVSHFQNDPSVEHFPMRGPTDPALGRKTIRDG